MSTAPGPATVAFSAGRRTVGVVLDDQTLGEAVAALLPPYLDRDAPDGPHLTCTLGHDGHHWLVVEPNGETTRAATLEDALVRLELLLVWILLDGLECYLHLHAAGQVRSPGALIALGPSGAGKSWLARAWARGGRPVYGDDVVLLDARGRAHAFRRRIATGGNGTKAATFDPVTEGAGWAEPALVETVALIQHRAGPVLVEDVGAAEVLAALSAAAMRTGRRPQEMFDTLVGVAQRARGIRVVFGEGAGVLEALA